MLPRPGPPRRPGRFWGQTLGTGSYAELYKVCEFTPEQQRRSPTWRPPARPPSPRARRIARPPWTTGGRPRRPKTPRRSPRPRRSSTTPGHALNESYGKTEKAIVELMTSEQKEKWRQYSTLTQFKIQYPGMKFSDEQWDKIIQLVRAVRPRQVTAPGSTIAQTPGQDGRPADARAEEAAGQGALAVQAHGRGLQDDRRADREDRRHSGRLRPQGSGSDRED